MGLAKTERIEAEERGWFEPDGYVCSACVEDAFLKKILQLNETNHGCDYCHSQIAAPFASLIKVIGNTVLHYFNEPSRAGFPSGNDFVLGPSNIRDVLNSLPLECNEKLFKNVADAFFHEAWVPAVGGRWASFRAHEIMGSSWACFVQMIKHEVRYFFRELTFPESIEPHAFEPRLILPIIGNLVKERELITSLSAGVSFYRVRERDANSKWEIASREMEAPPPNRARAGRMNPAGISYLYLAREPETALAEVLTAPPCEAVIARFDLLRNLKVLDLSKLPELPSIFDLDKCPDREGLLFLENFVSEISKPVRKDGREHIEYVPSQIVSEYFSLIFRDTDGDSLDGIMYPSALRNGGKNLVLFPKGRGFERKFDQIRYHSARQVILANWDVFLREVCPLEMRESLVI